MNYLVIVLSSFFFILRGQAAPAWDKTDALSDLYHAYATYCNTPSLAAWDCTWCDCPDCPNKDFEITSGFSNASYNTFGYVGYSDAKKEIVVAFRGTQMTSFTNWLENLDAVYSKKPFLGYEGAYVHRGFLDAYQSMASSVQQSLDLMLVSFPDYTLRITGHSLGGALAILCGVETARRHPSTLVNVQTFGGPRVGDKGFVAMVRNTTNIVTHWRMVNGKDPIPHVPPTEFSYHHIGTAIWIHDGQFIQCDGSGEDPKCSDQFYLPDHVNDHLSYMGLEEGCT